eukprot:GEZU01025080.1.p1 GENE.GEZU01025080.1~~GEZU01025080.1.p1  ORF type:complete len:389 (+),score=122.33 GEZU01025080.1:142-1308(+)
MGVDPDTARRALEQNQYSIVLAIEWLFSNNQAAPVSTTTTAAGATSHAGPPQSKHDKLIEDIIYSDEEAELEEDDEEEEEEEVEYEEEEEEVEVEKEVEVDEGEEQQQQEDEDEEGESDIDFNNNDNFFYIEEEDEEGPPLKLVDNVNYTIFDAARDGDLFAVMLWTFDRIPKWYDCTKQTEERAMKNPLNRVRDKDGNTPLYHACANNRRDVVMFLLWKGALDVGENCCMDVTTSRFIIGMLQDAKQTKSLHKHMQQQRKHEPEHVKQVIVPDHDTIYDAVKRNDNATVAAMLQAPAGRPDLRKQDSYGNTALYYASLIGSINLIRLLVANGATDNGVKSCWDAALSQKVRSELLALHIGPRSTANSSIKKPRQQHNKNKSSNRNRR